MSLLRLAYIIASRRTIKNKSVEAVLFTGILLAVTLMSSGVIFSDLLAEVELQRSLHRSSPNDINLSIKSYGRLGEPSYSNPEESYYRYSRTLVEQNVLEPLARYLSDQTFLLETFPFFFDGHDHIELDDSTRPRGRVYHMTDSIYEHTQLIYGHWPSVPNAANTSLKPSLEVAIDSLGSEFLDLGVGDTLNIFPVQKGEGWPQLTAKIVAVFARTDPNNEFWYGTKRTFSYKSDETVVVPLFTTESAIEQLMANTYPGLQSEMMWFFYTDRRNIRATDLPSIQASLDKVQKDVLSGINNARVIINLDKVLASYETKVLLARIPAFLLISLTTGILIYYLALASNLVARSRSAEISILKSRGATDLQICLLNLLEGLLLAIPSIIIGPFLALWLSEILGLAFVDIGDHLQSMPVALSLEAFCLGAAGGVLSILVLTISSLVAAKQNLVEFHQSGSRPPTQPLIHRYYIDLLIMIGIGIIWWQIQSRGSFLVRTLGEENIEVDPSIILGPVLGFLAFGLLILRFFPMAVGGLSKIVGPFGPAWVVQGLRHVSRDPIIPGALTVLLMITTALGVVGGTFRATFEQSERDQALYNVGADLRIQHVGSRLTPTITDNNYIRNLAIETTGTKAASEVQRAGGTILTRGLNNPEVSILAVNAETFADVSWFRPDFADGRSLTQLMDLIRTRSSNVRETDGLELPPDAKGLALWIHPGTTEPQASLIARLQDANGYYFDILLGQLNFNEWRKLETDFDPMPTWGNSRFAGFRRSASSNRTTETGTYTSTEPPFRLLSLKIYTRRSPRQDPGAIFIEELTASTPKGEHSLPSLQDSSKWHVVEDYSYPGLYALESSSSVTRPNSETSAAFSWTPGGIGLRSVRAGATERPVPAIVSPSVLELANAEIGDTITLGMTTSFIPIEAVATTNYFPTLNPSDSPFIILDLNTYIHSVNLHAQQITSGSNEIWVSLQESGDPQSVLDKLDLHRISVITSLISSDILLKELNQPYTNAGWGGLLVLMFLSLIIASISGVMLFSYSDVHDRRTEFALLNTLGLTKRQLIYVAWFNLGIVMIAGIILGTWAGHMLGSSMVPILEVAEHGLRITPPMIVQIDWSILMASYAVLAIVIICTGIWIAWIMFRLQIQSILRAGGR